MKKIYQSPLSQVIEVENTSVICTSEQSIQISTTGVNGNQALAKDLQIIEIVEQEDEELW